MLVSFGNNVKEVGSPLETRDIDWLDIVKEHQRNDVTCDEFQSMSKDKKAEIKQSYPYFVGCGYKNGKRDGLDAYGRELITLDADHGLPPVIEYDHLIYSTFSHTKRSPRYRILIPLTRAVNRHEYQHIVRSIMRELGEQYFDTKASVDYCRAMFIPSCPSDAEPVFDVNLDGFGGPVNPDDFTYPEYSPSLSMLGDPRSKSGIIGEFCSVYNVETAIDEFLSDVYEKDGNRYTFIGATSKKGGRIYDNGNHFYSDHDTDPANDGHCKNAYDLVRIHKFSGDEDKMSEWARSLPSVQEFIVSQFDKIEVAKEIVSKDESGLLDAPGILGDMIRDILPNMDRTVPDYAIGAALHSLSMVASQSYYSFSRSAKLNLMSVIIGESATGKDVPQRYVAQTAKLCNQIPWPDLTSYQEITKNLFRGKGKAYYVVDECQKMFNSQNSKEEYLSALGDEIMKISTAEGNHRFRGNDTENMLELCKKRKADLEKSKDGDIGDVDFDEIDKQINEIDKDIEMIKEGMPKPDLSIYGSTTPISFRSFMTEKALRSGFFARIAWSIPDIEGHIPPLNDVEAYECTGDFSGSIVGKLEAIINKEGQEPVRTSEEVKKAALAIKRELDDTKYRNHRFGEIYRRSYQNMTKVASILAAGDGGDVTIEHLEWAKKFTLHTIDRMTHHHREEELENSTDDNEIMEMYSRRIIDVLRKNGGDMKPGVLRQKVMRKKQYANKAHYDLAMKKLTADTHLFADPAVVSLSL